jgi:glycosyltransferase involved in cell wall biosynthesis
LGLPVYNGGRYVRQAVDSVLSQTYGDFELIISDNGSTDDTEHICGYYAASDARIRYYRSRTNRGASWNFSQVVALARGKYFKWMAHDDICAPEYLTRCVNVLERDLSVVLCYTRTIDIDEDGRRRKEKNFNLNVFDSRAHRRFRDVICINHSCFEIFGMIRRKALERTSLITAHVYADRVVLAELSLMGRFYRVEEDLFLHREHPGRSTRAMPTLQERIKWFDPSKDGKPTFPNWRLMRAYVGCVRRSGLRSPDNYLCYLQLARWLKRHYNLLWQDLAHGVRHLSGARQGSRRGLARLRTAPRFNAARRRTIRKEAL